MTIEYSSEKGSIKSLTNKVLRPSPSASATLFKVGTRKKGNDKGLWVVKITKSGVKRWNKLKI